MDKLFLTILNMSFTGAFVIAAICLVRLPLKKAPKIISYCLWAVAWFRLVCPFSIESVFSLIPFNAAPIPPDIAMQPVPRINSGIPFMNNAVSSVLPAASPTDSVNPLQVLTIIGAYVWLAGAAVILIYGMISYIRLSYKMRPAIPLEGNLYESDAIQSPFVIGVVKPKIYIPLGLSVQDRKYITVHERIHIRRLDYIFKLAAYIILCMHWFNPLAWVAFMLMGADMELSCDERVLKEMGMETKKDYSLSLLSLSSNQRVIRGSPLAFSENGLKTRIKNVLSFKKPRRAVVILAIAFAIALSAGFAVNKASATSLVPAGMGMKTYTLENMTEKQRLERMDSFTLYEDGTASFNIALISSYIPPKCTYSIEGGEVLFHPVIETDWDKGFYGVENGEVIARFSIVDENTLIFETAFIPLFAEPGGRYVAAPGNADTPAANFSYGDKPFKT